MTEQAGARPVLVPGAAVVGPWSRVGRLAAPHAGHAATWLVLSLATTATLCSTGFLPFYDYYQWLFQGHVVSVLLFGTGGSASDIAASYVLRPVPVPNLAAPVLIGLLNTVLPTETAGQVVVVLTALGLAGAFGHLARTLQGRPTAVEYLGFPWALGFFLYKGYLSYTVGVAGVFVLVALLHRIAERPPARWRPALLAVTGLGVLLYLSHLLAWLMGGLAVLGYALVLARHGRRAAAVQLVAALTPGVVLAAWYVLAEHGGTGVTLYSSWGDKAIALTETLQFFLRLDPFPPAFPLFWVNVALALAAVALVLSRLDRAAVRAAVRERPVLGLSGALAVVALALPISTVNDLIKPDERFVMPALLLAVAALPYRAGRPRLTALGPVLAALVVGLHLVEYTEVGTRIGRVDAATDATVPAGTSVLQLAVPSRFGCAASAGLVTGVPVLKWFAVDHALEAGPARVNVEETSLVHSRDPVATAATPATTVLAVDGPDVGPTVLAAAPIHPSVEVVACPSDLTEIERAIAARYRPQAHGDGYTIFARR